MTKKKIFVHCQHHGSAALENMYVTPDIFGMEQHQEQWKNNSSIVLRQFALRKPLA